MNETLISETALEAVRDEAFVAGAKFCALALLGGYLLGLVLNELLAPRAALERVELEHMCASCGQTRCNECGRPTDPILVRVVPAHALEPHTAGN